MCSGTHSYPVQKENIEWVQLCTTLDSILFFLQYKWVSKITFLTVFQKWCFLRLTSIMDDFHWYFRVVVAGIALLKCLWSSEFKVFQALSAPPDPTCITLRPRKIPLLLFVPSNFYLIMGCKSVPDSFPEMILSFACSFLVALKKSIF